MQIRTLAMAAALALAGCTGAASAQQTQPADKAEGSAAANASVSAANAVAAVEKAGNGKVTELTLTAGGANYAVTVMAADGTETNYVVDAKTGAVAQVNEAKADREGDEADGEEGDHGDEGEGEKED